MLAVIFRARDSVLAGGAEPEPLSLAWLGGVLNLPPFPLQLPPDWGIGSLDVSPLVNGQVPFAALQLRTAGDTSHRSCCAGLQFCEVKCSQTRPKSDACCLRTAP